MKKTVSLLLCLLMLAAMLAGCAGSGGNAAGKGGELAMKDASLHSDYVTDDNARVFYEIFVGSFSDSDGDGVGDLRGIINRMDYLNDGDPDSGLSLGIEGIWLTPIFKSPSYHKYDVSDYYSVDPIFGTMEDLKELVELCHARNVKLILDLPINHTGSMNQWFGDFVLAHRQGKTDSDAYDFYCWHGPNDQGISGHRYKAITGSDDWYECNFDDSMPELNFDSEAVRSALLDVARFYLEMGVDGFRFDAAKYIYLNDNAESAAFWVWYLEELRKDYPEMYTVAEVWDSDGITDIYYPATNCFNFTTAQAEGLIASTARAGDVGAFTGYVESYLNHVKQINPDAMYVPFIANHDTDRAAGYLTVASGQMKMAANLYILCPGSPFIYYGEEIGMKGSRGGSNTDANRRLAMVWNDEDTVKDPAGSSYSGKLEAGVAEQIKDENSLFNYYKRLIMIRKANPEIARGEYRAVRIDGTKAGGFLATWKGSTVLVLHNTTNSAVTIDVSSYGVSALSAFIGAETASLEGTTLSLGAQTSAVLR